MTVHVQDDTSEAGFALVEVLVAASLLAFVGVVLTSIIVGSVKRQREDKLRLLVLYQLEALASDVVGLGENEIQTITPTSSQFDVHISKLEIADLPQKLVAVELSVSLQGITERVTVLARREGLIGAE